MIKNILESRKLTAIICSGWQVLLFTLFVNCIGFAQDEPLLVLSSIKLEQENGGRLVPEIVVNNNGSWRKATLKDVWAGQDFEIFDQAQNPQSRGKVIVNSSNGGYYAEFSTKDNVDPGIYYWGIYKGRQQFQNVGFGKEIKPKYILNKADQKALFDKKKSIKQRLQNVIKQDWKNIKREFPQLQASYISDFMVGDITGDKKNDYILLLGDMDHIKGAAIFIYISNGMNYSMIPINFWKDASFSESWPRLFFMMDFNEDGAKEVVITNSDSDANYPRIYGWVKGRKALMILFSEEEPFYAW